MTDISKKQAVNPYLPSWEYVPDAEPRVFGDRVYMAAMTSLMEQIFVWEIMCAPDCIQGVDGRYYLYYHLHMLSCTGVAVSDSPVGPFEHYGYVQHADGTPWGEKKGDTFAFDPGVLVDDDNRVFYM